MTQLGNLAKNNFRGHRILVILLLGLVDLISIGLGFRSAVEIRRFMIPWIGGTIPPDAFTPILIQGLIIFIIVHAMIGLYPGFGRTAVEETQQIFYSLTLGYGLLALAIYFEQASLNLSRWTFFLGWGFGCILNMVFRFTARNRLSLFSWWGTPILVVGPIERTQEIIKNLTNSRRMGLRPVLILDETYQPDISHVLGIPVTNSRKQVESLIESTRIEYAVFAGQDLQDPALRWLSERFASVLVVLDTSPLGSAWVKTMDLEGRLVLKTQYHLLDRKALVVKRIFDIFIGISLGFILLPLMIVIALMIRSDSPGPVLYAQERMGKGGKRFPCYKFRTMQVGAEELLEDLINSDSYTFQEYKQYHKLTKDPRITRVGYFLRKFSLDELPQLWNIITGDLSLVGPRAYMPRELNDMGEFAPLIFRISPGLTGWWQVMGRHTTTFHQRLKLDEYYLSNWSLWLDVYIIIKTLWVILRGHGV